MKKPDPCSNNWLGNTVTGVELQIIDETDHWKTIGTCIDTPNAIAKELEDPKYTGLSIWFKRWSGRDYYKLIG